MSQGLFDFISDAVPEFTYPTLHGRVVLDFENYDPLIKTHGPSWCYDGVGHVVSLAYYGDDNQEGFAHIAHEQNNHDHRVLAHPPDKIGRWLQDQLNNPDLTLVFHNATYDLGWARRLGAKSWRCTVRDTGIMAPLLDEYRLSYELDALARDYLDDKERKLSMQDVLIKKTLGLRKGATKKEVMSRLHELPPSLLHTYNIQDCRMTYGLDSVLYQAIQDEDLTQICTLEHELIPVLLEMRQNGVRIDEEKAHAVKHQLLQEFGPLMNEMARMVGEPVQLWSGERLQRNFKTLDIPWTKMTAEGVASFRAQELERYDHPFVKKLVRARKIDKVVNTFIDGHILGHLVAGRIHATFSPLRSDDGGAVSGRFASSNPNLQNLPSRDEEMTEMIRSLFLPEVGELWASSDFSSQEPRVCVHYAHACGIPSVMGFVRAYHDNPYLDFHARGAEITGLPRKIAKNLTLGKMYRMGGAKLCKSLNLPTEVKYDEGKGVSYEVAGEEGQRMMDQYDAAMPFVRELNNLCERKATVRHWIRTLLGRKCRFRDKDDKDDRFRALPYKALNRLIQSSSADMLKQAMINLHKQGVRLLVTVHDEVGLSVPDEQTGVMCRDIMVDSIKLHIPVVADLEMGPSWGNMTLIKPN